VLYTCNVAINPSAPNGVYPLHGFEPALGRTRMAVARSQTMATSAWASSRPRRPPVPMRPPR
jgi:hypothetical protein